MLTRRVLGPRSGPRPMTRRWLAWMGVFVLALAALLGPSAAGALAGGDSGNGKGSQPNDVSTVSTSSQGGTVYWNGSRGLDARPCTGQWAGYTHWIFTTGGGDVTAATLTINGTNYPMTENKDNGSSSWSVYVPGGAPAAPTSVYVTYVGTLGKGSANLTISCLGTPTTTTSTSTQQTTQQTTAQTTQQTTQQTTAQTTAQTTNQTQQTTHHTTNQTTQTTNQTTATGQVSGVRGSAPPTGGVKGVTGTPGPTGGVLPVTSTDGSAPGQGGPISLVLLLLAASTLGLLVASPLPRRIRRR